MTDRELLELAAKAANINGCYIEEDDWYGEGILFTDEDDCNHCWNPLIDDGEALRLAVKFQMTIIANREIDGGVSAQVDYTLWTPSSIWAEELIEHDPYYSVRRAIVRVAAAIGNEMP